ncbi:MAG TPA: SDR family oxidoreductase [Acidimicrobiia bacterium]|nr:SDR family oxidoreductase [Acidimicrobiia bacterium]
MSDSSVVVVGGTSGLGLEVARHYAAAGRKVVITGRDAARAAAAAKEIGGATSGIAFDLAEPLAIAPALAALGAVDRLVLAAIERDNNPVRDYDIASATRLVTLKLVGYTETIHTLIPRMTPDASVVLFGGRAKDRPYPGSTTVSTVNGGITGLINTLVVELAPIRFNAIHPGIVSDTPNWKGKALDAVVARTPTKRLATMQEVVGATVFLLENTAVNGTNLYVDGGWMLM